jgi:hypothetical protein
MATEVTSIDIHIQRFNQHGVCALALYSGSKQCNHCLIQRFWVTYKFVEIFGKLALSLSFYTSMKMRAIQLFDTILERLIRDPLIECFFEAGVRPIQCRFAGPKYCLIKPHLMFPSVSLVGIVLRKVNLLFTINNIIIYNN